MGRKYKNPPIVEALCEFQFVSSQPWDFAIPGMLYERIKGDFPIRGQQMAFDIVLEPKEGGKTEQRIEFGSPRLRFFNKDKNSLVQVGPDLLTINHLKPYPTWEVFKPLILRILHEYVNVANPKGFKRIGLRYINKIDFEGNEIELSDYFNYRPLTPNNLPQEYKSFQVTVEFPYENERDALRLTLATIIPEKPNILSLALDLDYIMIKPESVKLDEVSTWLENAHMIIEDAFESCITDKSRKLFEEVK
jgi:uncharacterized protein (TIGR04255 family)